jgi:hypothetical protein
LRLEGVGEETWPELASVVEEECQSEGLHISVAGPQQAWRRILTWPPAVGEVALRAGVVEVEEEAL